MRDLLDVAERASLLITAQCKRVQAAEGLVQGSGLRTESVKYRGLGLRV